MTAPMRSGLYKGKLMAKIQTQTLGYPYIGKKREIKRALEAYWKGKIDRDSLLQTFRQVEEESWQSQRAAGVDRIGVGGATLYDHVLDWVVRFGLIPLRFRELEGLGRYFAMARGVPAIPALELTKWFDTNYHYLVPELDHDLKPETDFADFLERVKRARGLLGDQAVPIVLGPITLLHLSWLARPLGEVLETLLPLYRRLLEDLKSLGVQAVQLHEPALVLGGAGNLKEHYQATYSALAQVNLPINLVTYFDDLGETYPWVVELPVSIISLDFTRGKNLELIKKHGWPKDKTLAAGVVDGRNVWCIRPREILALLEELQSLAPVRVSTSCSLQFVPYQASRETKLPDPLRGALAFAEEKLHELHLLARTLGGEETEAEIREVESAWERFRTFAPRDPELQGKLQALTSDDFQRALAYKERRQRQLQLSPFPTTTIGSFPQTSEVRRLRARFKRGEISQAEYQAGIDAWIAYTIGVQEGLGLDVLVHGEFERPDMVEYFAQKMKGFALTENGWVQSYGNRYVRPPIIYADVLRPEPMTVREFRVAQSFTSKPVKGMLTGPVTILNWSYPRTDISRKEVAFQIALALRGEMADLEAAGACVIQVDEPALREGLPLKPERWQDYLIWAVDAFRLTTTGARPETQVQTHMCYAEFGDILEAIDRLGADVILIENARSSDKTLRELAQYGYEREVGLGVYDIHSPVVPDEEAILAKLRIFLKHLRPEQIWVNPDCGLKTRVWEEVNPSLDHIVKAVHVFREEVRTAQEG